MLDAPSISDPPATSMPRTGRLFEFALVVLGAVGVLSVFNTFDLTWTKPSMFALIGAIAALMMMSAAVAAIVVADRRDVAELGLLGNGLLSMAVLSAAQAAVTPDALFDRNEAFGLAGLLVIPAGAASALPVLFAGSAMGRWGARNWRDWSLLTTLGAFVIAFAFAGLPNVWSAPSPRSPLSIIACAAAFVAMLVIAVRFRKRHVASGSNDFVVMWAAAGGLAISALAPMADAYGAGFWGLRLVGFVAAIVLAMACVALGNSSTRTQHAFAPVLADDPFLSLDLLASPVVRRHVNSDADGAELANTADLALQVARRMGLSAAQRRQLGVAAVLHDVGKSLVPAEILSKPGSLSDAEFRLVQEHAANGAQILSTDPLLAPCAHIVRAHHERVDGTGYPDRLSGSVIPVEARIIAVCDAFDAITHDREYRRGLPVGLSLAILRSNAGQQWDADVVRHLMLVVAANDLAGPVSDEVLEVPDDLAELLVQVDCEI